MNTPVVKKYTSTFAFPTKTMFELELSAQQDLYTPPNMEYFFLSFWY